MAIIDKIVSFLRESGSEIRLTYNRHRIAMGSSGYNFCWFSPRKLGNCHIECRFSLEVRDAAVADLQTGGIDASPLRTDHAAFSVNIKALDAQKAVLIDILKRAEEWSKR